MYFSIQYIEYPDYKFQKELEAKQAACNSEIFSLDPSDELESKELLVNPDSYLGSILDYICEVACLTPDQNFDLCRENGDLMNIKSLPVSTMGLELFQPKEIYYVICREMDESTGQDTVAPLINRGSKQFSILMQNLRSNEPTGSLKKRRSIRSTKGSVKSIDKESSARVITSRSQRKVKGINRLK